MANISASIQALDHPVDARDRPGQATRDTDAIPPRIHAKCKSRRMARHSSPHCAASKPSEPISGPLQRSLTDSPAAAPAEHHPSKPNNRMPSLRSVAAMAVSAAADALPPVYHIALGKGGGGGGGGGKGGRSSGTRTSSGKSSGSSFFFFGGDGDLNWWQTLLFMAVLGVAFVVGVFLYIHISQCLANCRARRGQKLAAAQALEPKKEPGFEESMTSLESPTDSSSDSPPSTTPLVRLESAV